jgi:hypothetical protein
VTLCRARRDPGEQRQRCKFHSVVRCWTKYLTFSLVLANQPVSCRLKAQLHCLCSGRVMLRSPFIANNPAKKLHERSIPRQSTTSTVYHRLEIGNCLLIIAGADVLFRLRFKHELGPDAAPLSICSFHLHRATRRLYLWHCAPLPVAQLWYGEYLRPTWKRSLGRRL